MSYLETSCIKTTITSMTLILSCINKDTIYQISDRRLIQLQEPYSVVDDESNKAVLLDGRIAFGYTGLASLGGVRTDEWLMKVLLEGSNEDFGLTIDRIKSRANSEFHKLNIPKQFKRHAFQAVGWFRMKTKGVYKPGIVTIHNALDHNTGNWLPEARPEFSVDARIRGKKDPKLIIRSVGVNPTNKENEVIFRNMRKISKHSSTNIGTVENAFISSLRWLSSRHKEIGPGLISICLPKNAVEQIDKTGDVLILAGSPLENKPTFNYISATNVKEIFGPIAVLGGSSFTNFRAGSL